MNPKKALFSLSFFLIFSVSAFGQISQFKATFIKAQQENKEVVVTISDGNTFSGFVDTIGEESAGVKTKNGVFNFRYDRIVDVKIIDTGDESSRWKDNPAKNKLFIFQTGKMLDGGSGYYQNTYIFFSNFSYGITDNISVDAGFSMFPGARIKNQLYAFGAKAGTNITNHFAISVNAKYYTIYDSDKGVTTLFGSGTYSTGKLDLTGSAGMGFFDTETSEPIFILGGQFRVSDRFAFLSENIILPTGDRESEALLSFGGRVISTKSAFDLGFFFIESETVVPFLSYTLKF
tara:strand:+ start:465 stop:1334 length:870 start_codon:yes stop_codon:yes gene_type:complete